MSGVPLIDGRFRVLDDGIDPNHEFTLRDDSRLHPIGLGRRYAGTSVLVLSTARPEPDPERAVRQSRRPAGARVAHHRQVMAQARGAASLGHRTSTEVAAMARWEPPEAGLLDAVPVGRR